jgi:hypothetical protein
LLFSFFVFFFFPSRCPLKELEGDSDGKDLPPELVGALSSMKDDIASLQQEMQDIQNEVKNAVAAIQQQTTSMLTQVAQIDLNAEEGAAGEEEEKK